MLLVPLERYYWSNNHYLVFVVRQIMSDSSSSSSSSQSFSSNRSPLVSKRMKVDDIQESCLSSSSVSSNDERNVSISNGIHHEYNKDEESDDNISLFSHSSLQPSYTHYNRRTLSNSITDACVHSSEKFVERCSFQYFSKLKVLRLHNGLEIIGDSACKGCVSLESINIPYTVKEIGSSAFRRCISLKSLFISPGLEIIHYCAFRRCVSLEEISIPNTVRELGYGSFSYCQRLCTVSLSPGLECIGSHSFRECKSLNAITIPPTVTRLGRYSFSGCTNLKVVNLSEGLQLVDEFAFWNCKSLQSITIPSTTKEISDHAFSNCTALTNVQLKEGIERFGSQVFFECRSLVTINIPSSVRVFKHYPFEYCDSLLIINFCEEMTDFMTNNRISWWQNVNFYEDELEFTPYQARINMLYEQAMSYYYLRNWKIFSRLPLMASWSREHIIALLRDIPRSGKTLYTSFFDIHCLISQCEFIHDCLYSMELGLWQSGMREISNMDLSAAVEALRPLIIPLLLNSQLLTIDEEWLAHPEVSEIINRFNIGYLAG